MSRRNIEPEIFGESNFDEYTTRDEPIQKSFYEKYGFDERDGPPEQEDDDNAPWGQMG